ncbi:unnamed protein product [Sphacelaria rigidula]
MLRSARAGSIFLRNITAAGPRCRRVDNAGSAAISRVGATHAAPHSFVGQHVRFLSAAPGSVDEGKDGAEPQGFMRMMGKDSCVAAPDYTNRWAMVAPAFLTHMCIGSPWAWSVMSGTLTREMGVVASAASDWSMAEATIPLSIVFALQGIAAALGGKWALDVGPRLSMAVASVCFGGGMMLGGLGVEYHSLPLVYGGYGLMGGTGVGLAYTPPVQTLISWFPDKKGLASGLTIAGFGSGALVFTPLVNTLMDKFSKMPTYLGKMDEVSTMMKDGKMFAETASGLAEVVSVNAAELSRLPYDIAEGVYVVGTGSTGAAASLGVCGALYGALMLTSSMAIRTPHPDYKVPGLVDDTAKDEPSTIRSCPLAQNNVTPAMAMKTPQFYGLATTFFCVACGGMGLFSVAKPMMGEVFSSTLPTLVTASFASLYVQVLAAGNLGGRIGWAAFSDKFGRKPTFNMFCLGSIPLYLAVPYTVQQVVETGSSVPLGMFVGSTLVAITFMGGVYAILPAYEADLFGPKYVGPIHGRVLLASSAAALAGPSILLSLRSRSEVSAIHDLVSKVDPARFQQVFHAGVEEAQALIDVRPLAAYNP